MSKITIDPALQAEVLRLAREHFESIVEIRRDIHRNPEIGFEVHRTAAVAAREMRALGLKVKENVGRTGVQADLEVPGATRRIAIRADMDALPMDELRDKPYKSTVPGAAHMCGHDAHTAMLIGGARILKTLAPKLKTSVRFVFQPNEENLPGGAPAMIEDGVLDGVDEIYGMHVWPLHDTGRVGICRGPATAQPNEVYIEIKGVGGHAAEPQLAIDPILIAAQFLTNVQSVVSRAVDPQQPAVFSITQFHAGTTTNVIPESVKLAGTLRTYNKEIQALVRKKVDDLLKGLCAANGASYSLQFFEGYPVSLNALQSSDRVAAVMTQLLGAEHVRYPDRASMVAEDFGFYCEKVPGNFMFLGTRNLAKETGYMCHDPRFDIDEDAMVYGMAHHALVALSY
ncbi:MAG TPA: amidohydrolase [Bdellovibrionota bacterium]|jgi:amidohydrolase|nr:amidohydrolase [Bdellovibrionota bacterium]